MAEVIPFRGIYYNIAEVSGGDVVAPPYDIITPEIRESLYGKSPYNIVRVDSGKELEGDGETENKYKRAVEYFNGWLEEGILTRGEKAFYAYEMRYEIRGKAKTVAGFFGLVRLEELGSGIYPHECTHSTPKKDRLTLMRTCNANTSPIFSLYRSRQKGASAALKKIIGLKPYMEAKDLNGSIHRLWHITDGESIEAIRRDLSGKAIYIADGHHRYETALQYRDDMRKGRGFKGDEPYNYVLMFLANIEDGDLTILPAHRLVGTEGDIIGRLGEYFDIQEVSGDADMADAISGQNNTFGLYLKDKQYILKYRGRDLGEIHPVLRGLDVVILHELVFKRLLHATDIAYEMDKDSVRSKVDSGEFRAAFFLNPTGVEEVERVALSNLRMPPKSTYFYPKVMTGFIINSLNN